MDFLVKAKHNFNDKYTGQLYKAGDLLGFDDVERVKDMVQRNIVELRGITPRGIKKHGKRVIIYQNLLYVIGGIETADYNLARAFKDRNLVFVFREADIEQAIRIGKYADVVIDDGKEFYECDVLILANYDAYRFIEGRFSAGKIYQQVHADWANMKKMPMWSRFEWKPEECVNRVLAASGTASIALKTAFNEPIESVVVPNILLPPEDDGFRIFLTLSRLTPEKGADLILKTVERFHEERKQFLWIICATLSSSRLDQALRKDNSVLFLPPSVRNEALIPKADVLVQLSKNESYCYSVHQALSMGVPCLCTDIPEFRKVIRQGENGWLVSQSLDGLDIEGIFGERLKFEPIKEEIDPIWEAVLEGEL